MKDLLNDDEISHPLNESLLREAEEIKGERKTYKERLDRLEETRSQVSGAVYQRVRSDYISKLDKTTERLISLKRDLESEEKKLVEKKGLVEVNIRLHRERIEESSLRHSLGEYDAERHRELITREEQEIARLETALKSLSDGLVRHTGILEGEELTARAAPPARVQEPPPRPSPTATPAASATPATGVAPAASTAPVTENTTKIRLDVRGTDKQAIEAKKTQRVSEILVMDKGNVIQNVPIDRTIQIGRSPSNDIVLKEPKVSRKHAEIQYVGGNYVLLDLESSNGTYVSGKKVAEQVLKPNDEITIGNTKMIFKG